MDYLLNDINIDLANTRAKLDQFRHKLQWGQLVPVRSLGEGSDFGNVDSGAAPIVSIAQICKAIFFVITADAKVWRVFWDDEAVSADRLTGIPSEDIAFDKGLVVRSRVDGLVVEIFVVVVVNMMETETAGGTTGSKTLPEIVVVGNVIFAQFMGESGFVSDQGSFPVVMKIVPRNGDIIRSPDNIDQTVLSKKPLLVAVQVLGTY